MRVKSQSETYPLKKERERVKYSTNETVKYFNRINKVLFLCGLPGFWVEDVILPIGFYKRYNIVKDVMDIILGAVAIIIFLALFTQNNISKDEKFFKQITSYVVSTCYFYYLILKFRRSTIRDILYQLTVVSKEIHVDETIDRQMIKTITKCSFLYLCGFLLVGIRAGVIMVGNYLAGGPAISTMTAWPDIEDMSQLAQIVRFVIYVVWLLLGFRTVASHLLIFAVLICLSHQFKHIQSYFYSLDNKFKQGISQEKKEYEYQEAFKKGIKLHVDALRCTRVCQSVLGIIFSNEAVMVTQVLFPMICDLVQPENNPFVKIPAVVSCLASSALFWCNAGDIKVEAFKISDAMYHSGWKHCTGKSVVPVRKMLVISMVQAQQPIVLRALGHIELSYESFLALVASAFTAFVMLY